MLFSDKQKKILALLADGEFHSGTALAKALGISRSAICKQLQGLSEWGLHPAAVSGKGYRLAQPLALLTEDGIMGQLEPHNKALVSRLEIHDSLASTNTYLLEQAQANAPSGVVCFAEHQSAGKGRRGRQWVSPYGSNIYLSVLWRFQQGGIASTSGLSLAIGIAVIRALKQHFIHDVGLKWPNDIFSLGKKLGGILIEVSGESDGPCVAVIGLGLNLYIPETEGLAINQAWTDLSKISAGVPINKIQLAGSVLNQLLAILINFETTGLKPYLDEWRSYDSLLGRSATLYIGQQQIVGTVCGINDQGLLLIKKPDGQVQAFASGEVSFNEASV
ncbi:MAG: bifunctional biotin--[acetyl-CoA-carboxylase] ligase/biotin operon repressor BirA [Methylococcales bacterium]|nr:bifunctional biotin--[acetyl-CoA-carboxylase] ligase/biotin operon repressor BirA [Methylococcales bacterium]